MIHSHSEFVFKLVATFFVRTGEFLVARFVVVLDVILEHGCQKTDVQKIVLCSAAHHVLPHQNAFLVAVVVPAQRLDFDVLAQHIEAHGFDHFHVPFECGVGRRRKHAVRPITLVEKSRVEVWLVVEPHTLEALAVRHPTEFAHAEVGFDYVVAHFERYVVKFGVFGGPKLVIFKFDACRVACELSAVNRLFAVHDYDVHGDVCGFFEFEIDGVGVDVGDDGDVFEIHFVHAFNPHALPDARLRSVPDSARFGGLFCVSVIACVARVGYDEFDDVFTRLDCARYIEREGNVAADMLADGNAVESDRTNHIHCVEMQNRHRLDETFVKIESAMIIECVVGGLLSCPREAPKANTRERTEREFCLDTCRQSPRSYAKSHSPTRR